MVDARAREAGLEQLLPSIEPSDHGDFLVFVAPGRRQLVWVRVGDVGKQPTGSDVAIRIYTLATDGKAAPVTRALTFAELFSAVEIAAIPMSTAGWRWTASDPSSHGAQLVLPIGKGSATITLDATTGIAKRGR